MQSQEWCVYLLRCADDSLYCGITNDINNRIKLHQSGKGSKYVRSRLPCSLVYSRVFESQSLALQREAEIKKMKKIQKEILIMR